MEGDVVGRGAELGAIESFLDRLAHGPAAMVFEGAPGIGKTTVWRAGVEHADGRSFTVLSCGAVEAEAKLAFTALADLLEPVADRILPQLPPPQRLALEVALMRAVPHGAPPGARAVATALLSAFRGLAADSPIVIALDDVQWLDRTSGEALAFALRRIGTHRVGVLAAIPVEQHGARDPLALGNAFAERIERIRLGPLSLSALHHVIRSHLSHAFARPTLRRIADTSGGNPFFALELARALLAAGTQPAPGEPLPVPDTVSSLVLQRLERLPASARAALLVVAALSAPTVDLVRQAVGANADTALASAERAGMIQVRAGQVRFTHPLLASAVYASAASEKRRDGHRRLAEIIAVPEERARHLALATSEPDAEVARALDDASLLALRRGAPDAAGELQELAARVTARHDVAASRRRRTQAAEHFFHAGDRAHARALLETVLAEDPSLSERVTVLHLLGQIRAQEDSFIDAIRYLEEALAHAGGVSTSVQIRLDLAYAKYSVVDPVGALACAREALVEAEQLNDSGLIACALSVVVFSEFQLGLGVDRDKLERALALEDRSRAGQLMLRPTAVAGMLATYEFRVADAEALLGEMCAWATERGEESGLPFLLFYLSWLAGCSGNFAAAVAYAEEALTLSVQSGSDTMRALAFIHRGRARGARGAVTGAREDFTVAGGLLEQTGYAAATHLLLASRAALELSLGNLDAAARTLEPLIALVEADGFTELTAPLAPDVIEVLIHVGERPRAEALLDVLAPRLQQIDQPWARASAARCRSLLTAAGGDLDTALAAAEDAVARWQPRQMPIELGRALIALGRVQRRRGARRAARAALDRALTLFGDIGASVWAERAAEELRRLPIRRSVSKDELTPTEEQVAALAAAGRTNREVARMLHMSPKTVEANLSRIYDKLGIRSRAELGARMIERGQTAPEAKK